MKTKTIFMALLALAVAGVITSVLLANRQPATKPADLTVAALPKVTAPPAVVPAKVAAVVATEISVPGKITAMPTAQKKLPASPVVQKQNSGSGQKIKEPIQDPDARAALSMVGADPEAEQYWAAAINDPNLPANERKDLIEDLNEDGLSDPNHPGPQDLSLILNRLRLIDELAPLAMDQVNAEAFQEAQKDLLAMLDGKPVQ